MPKTTTKDPWRLRRCKNCKLTYKPTGKDRGNAERSIFCTQKCRTAYHNGGGMNMARFQEVATRAIIKTLKAHPEFLEGLSDQLRSNNMGSMVRQIAQEEIQKECAVGGTVRTVIDGIGERELALVGKVSDLRKAMEGMRNTVASIMRQIDSGDSFAPAERRETTS